MWDHDHSADEEGQHRTLKLAIQVGLVSLGIALVVLLVAPTLIDWNRYKPEVEAMLARSIGRPIKINGSLDATLLWTPALMASDVSLPNVPGGSAPDMVRLERLDARMDLFPLFAGKIRVRTIRLLGPVLSVETLADGRLNVQQRTEAAEPAKEPGLGFGWFWLKPEDISIESIVVDRGTLLYRDLKAGWSEQLNGVSLTLGVPSLAGPYTLKGAFDWRGKRYDASFDEALPQEGKRAVGLKISRTETGMSLSFAGRTERTPEGPGVSGALSLRAARPRALIAPASKSARTESAFALESVVSASARGASFRDLIVQWGAFSATGHAQAQFASPWSAAVTLKGRGLDGDAIWPAAKEDPSFWPLALVGTAQTRSEPVDVPRGLFEIVPLALDLTLEAATLRKGLVENVHLKGQWQKEGLSLEKLTGRLPGETDLELRGRAANGQFQGEAALAGQHARDFLGWLGLPVDGVPQARLKIFAYRGGLTFGEGTVTFRPFEAALDGGLASGSLSVAPASRIRVDGDLKISRLNLDPYAPLWRTPADGGETQAVAATDRFALAPVLDSVEKVDGALKLQIDSLTWRQVKMGGVAADLAHEGDTLSIRSLTIADVDGARLAMTGEGKALSGKASLTASATLDGNDIAPALVLAGVLSDDSRTVLGPGSVTITSTLADGTGSLHAEGKLDAATVRFDAEMTDNERPLLGILGGGRFKSTLKLESSNVADLASPFGFAAPHTAPSAPRAGTLSLLRERAPDASALTLDLRAGDAVATGRWTRTGRETPAYDGSLTVKIPDLARLFASLGADTPKSLRPGEALSLSVTGQGPQAGIVVQSLAFALGGDSLTGEGGLDLSGVVPRLDLGVKGTSLDLDRIAALWRSWHGRSALQGWSESPLPLEGLRSIDGSLNLEAQKIRVFGLPFETPHFSAKLANGALAFTDGRATIFGGPMTANWTLRGGDGPPGLAASVKFIDADGRALSEALWDMPLLDARLNGALSLSATGISERALAASLNGDLTLRSKGGSVRGFDLEGFEATRSGLVAGENPDRAIAKLQTGSSDYRGLDLKASVEGGTVRITEGALEFANGDAPLSGGIDAVNQTLALSIDLPATDAPPAILTVNGPLAHPKRLLDAKALRAQLAKESSRRQPAPTVDQAPLTTAPTPVHAGDTLNDAIGTLPSAR